MVGQQVIHSLALGSIYALVAVGFTFMSTAQRSLSVAYGSLYAMGGYVTWWTMRTTHTVWMALSIAVLLCTVVGMGLRWGRRLGIADTSEGLDHGVGHLV
jgi:branched-subunit amino acid ABC-type transport system permease component